MVANIKIRTEDVSEILDLKIRTTSAHPQLDVAQGESYDSVLTKIAARSPTLDEKQALDSSESPSATNHFVTLSELNETLEERIPWKTIGQPGSGADFEGDTDAAFTQAFADGHTWYQVKEGIYNFSNTVTLPPEVRLTGSTAESCIITGDFAGPLLEISSDTLISYLSFEQLAPGATALSVSGSNVELMYVDLLSDISGFTVTSTAAFDNLRFLFVASRTGSLNLSNCNDCSVLGVLFDAPGVVALELSDNENVTVSNSIFKNGQLQITSGTNIRVVGNHLNDGVVNDTPISGVILRANTPNANNNEIDDFQNILAYIGSPNILAGNPSYANNFAGPPGEDLTSRASTMDLLIQWRYEERNFHLVAESEPTYLTWTPSTRTLSGTGPLNLISSHRDASWVLPRLGGSYRITFAQNAQAASVGEPWTGDPQLKGQTFIASANAVLTQAEFELLRPATVTSGTIVASVYAVTSGLPTGGALAVSSPVSVSTLPTAAGPVQFNFTSPTTLTAGVTYAVVLRSTGGVFTSPLTVSASGSGGGLLRSQNNGTVWANDINNSLLFKVSGTATNAISIPDGSALYYILDRSLGTAPITLSPFIEPLGSIPNSRDSRQIYVAAFCVGKTLWWRGGGGTRFPGTSDQVGTYFVDGSSRSFLQFLGAADYNDFDPAYTDNFAGVQSESLTVRTSKTDTLIRRLFEFTNFSVQMTPGSFLFAEPGPTAGVQRLTLSDSLYFSLPHRQGRVVQAPGFWDLAVDEILYCTYDQATLASGDQATLSATVAAVGALPLPDNYPQNLKHVVLARRILSGIYLWDGTFLPIGGRYPLPYGRSVIRTALPTALQDSIIWTGTNLLWEKLALATSTGSPLNRNTFVDQITPSAGLTDLINNQAILVTHTWNSGAAQNVQLQKVTLPVTVALQQNQFLWVQNIGGNLVFDS